LGDRIFSTEGRQGFFRIYTNPASTGINPYNGFLPQYQLPMWNGTGTQRSFWEEQDGDSIASAVVTDMVLHMSVKLRANRQDRFFSANIASTSPLLSLQTTIDPTLASPDARFQDPNNTSYSSPWAEVAYFLVKNGDFAGSTPLYTLYRAQYVVVPDNSQLNSPLNNAQFPASDFGKYREMSCEVSSNGYVYFNSPTDLAQQIAVLNPLRRAFDPAQALNYDLIANPPPSAATFVVGDVISFEIQVLMDGAASFQYMQEFDSAFGGTISAVQITIRVWDKKTLQTRQITIVQDM
jgi:hypothetical protein